MGKQNRRKARPPRPARVSSCLYKCTARNFTAHWTSKGLLMKSPSSSTGCIVSQSLHADKHYHPKRLLGPDHKMCSSRKVFNSLKSVEKHLLPVIARIPRAEGKEGRRLNLSAGRGADRRKCQLRGTERTTARSLARSKLQFRQIRTNHADDDSGQRDQKGRGGKTRTEEIGGD